MEGRLEIKINLTKASYQFTTSVQLSFS